MEGIVVTFTAEELLEKINSFDENEWYESGREYGEPEYLGDFFYQGGTVPGMGEFRVVASWNLGDGHEQGVVFEHEESGRFFRATGWYSSWDTGEWQEMDEVEPYQKVVTRYRKVES